MIKEIKVHIVECDNCHQLLYEYPTNEIQRTAIFTNKDYAIKIAQDQMWSYEKGNKVLCPACQIGVK